MKKKSCTRKIPDLITSYELQNMCNEISLFFKLLPERGLFEKAKSRKCCKTSNAQKATAFFICGDGHQVEESVDLEN